MKRERFEDIEAWQLVRKLKRNVCRLTKKPKFAEDYGFKKQIQDVAGSLIHNTRLLNSLRINVLNICVIKYEGQ